MGLPVFTVLANLETAWPWDVIGWACVRSVASPHSAALGERVFVYDVDTKSLGIVCHMTERRTPGVFLLFVGLTVLQPALFVLVGALGHPNTGGIAFMVVLVLALAYGSRLAWVLLIVLNAIPLLAIGAAFGPGVLWSHVVVMVVTGVALEATLCSRAMREHIGRRGNRSDLPAPSF